MTASRASLFAFSVFAAPAALAALAASACSSAPDAPAADPNAAAADAGGVTPAGDASPAPPASDGSVTPRAGDASLPPTADAGPPPTGDASDASSGPAGWVPSLMAVGYGGLRVISRDVGLTWKNDQEIETAGGDDKDLFRGVAYGNGVWVTTGWRFFRSIDGGLTWSENAAPSGCGLMEGVAFGGGHFLGTCGTDVYESTDGVAWTHVGPVGDTGGHTYVFWDGGKFYSSGDSGKSFASPDGHAWTELAGVTKVAACDGKLQTRTECPGFWTAGITFGSEWESKITRSTDKTRWTVVHDNQALSPGNNAPYTPYAFALGFSPP